MKKTFKKSVKKLFAAVLVGALSVSALTACGSSDDSKGTDSTSSDAGACGNSRR